MYVLIIATCRTCPEAELARSSLLLHRWILSGTSSKKNASGVSTPMFLPSWRQLDLARPGVIEMPVACQEGRKGLIRKGVQPNSRLSGAVTRKSRKTPNMHVGRPTLTSSAIWLESQALIAKSSTNITGPDSLVDKASASGAGGRRFDSQCRRHWGSFWYGRLVSRQLVKRNGYQFLACLVPGKRMGFGK